MATATDTKTQNALIGHFPVSHFENRPKSGSSNLGVRPKTVLEKGTECFELILSPDGFILDPEEASYLIARNKFAVRYLKYFKTPAEIDQYLRGMEISASFQRFEIIKELANDTRQRPKLSSEPSIIEFVKENLDQAPLVSLGWKTDVAIERLTRIFEFDESEAKTLVAIMCVNDLARTPKDNPNLKDLNNKERKDYRLFVLDNFDGLTPEKKAQFISDVLVEYSLCSANNTTSSIIDFVNNQAKELLNTNEVKQIIESLSVEICERIIGVADPSHTGKVVNQLQAIGLDTKMKEVANENFSLAIDRTDSYHIINRSLPFADPDVVLKKTKSLLKEYGSLSTDQSFEHRLTMFAYTINEILTRKILDVDKSIELLDAISNMRMKPSLEKQFKKRFEHDILSRLSQGKGKNALPDEVGKHLVIAFGDDHLTTMITFGLIKPDEALDIISELTAKATGVNKAQAKKIIGAMVDPNVTDDGAYAEINLAYDALRRCNVGALEVAPAIQAVTL